MNVIGCDLGTGQDIWSMRRQLQDVNAWYPVESGWGALEDVESEELKLLSPKIITDDQNRAHLFWSKAESMAPDSLGKSIYYAVRQEGQWSPSAEILLSSSGKAEQIDAGIDSNNQISIVWSGGQGGEIFFSQADFSQAFIPGSWSDAIILPSPLPVGSSPDILINGNDVIYVSYAIPLNEQRGIYLTKSEDKGLTWMDSAPVFDAQEAEWGMVDNPKLAKTGNGDLHIVWTRYSLPTGEGPLGLYYARSSDAGLTWSEPGLVVEGPVVWSDIVGLGSNTVQRVWQQRGSSGSTLWHEQSTDGGQTWERIAPVSVFGEIVANPSLLPDGSGRLHLLLIVRNGVTSYLLQHWVYDGQSWKSESGLGLEFLPQSNINSLTSDFSEGGTLSVLLLISNHSREITEQYRLIYSNHSIEGQISAPTPTFEITSVPTNTPTSVLTSLEAVSTPTQTPTEATQIDFPVTQDISTTSEWYLIVGPVAIGLIIVVVIVLIVRWIRR
jgi:hypothetical protein